MFSYKWLNKKTGKSGIVVVEKAKSAHQITAIVNTLNRSGNGNIIYMVVKNNET